MGYGYRCPSCRTTNALHTEGCQHAHAAPEAIEKAHIDILSVLSTCRRSEESLKDEAHNGWSPIHEDVLDLYMNEGRIVHRPAEEDLPVPRLPDEDDETVLYLRTPDEYRAQLVPTEAHIKTVWEHGPADGCKDDALVAAISWHEWRDFSWKETRSRIADWLRDTGAWERGSWEESSIEELLNDKQHVFEESYGWKQTAKQAESVLEGRVA